LRDQGIVVTGPSCVNQIVASAVDGLIAGVGWALIPARCLVCGERPSGRRRRRLDLCRGCHAGLPRIRIACPRCARPTPTAETCGRCRSAPMPWDAARVAFEYRPPVDTLLLALKFRADLAPGVLLGRLLAAHLRFTEVELIIPIPLSPARQAVRRYNQAYELALPVQHRSGIRIATTALRRVRDTPPQIGLSASARRRNLRGAFVADPRQVQGRRIAILDDVITTGATLAAATRAARAAGAASIEVWAIARAP
jgi:ComF family protein